MCFCRLAFVGGFGQSRLGRGGNRIEIPASARARHIVRVHVRAWRDVRRRRADCAPVLDDLISDANRA
jgi:hypothetical protein